MLWKNSHERYGVISQLLHWLILVLITVQFVMGRIAQDLPLGMEKLIIMSRHKSLGITILLLAILRLGWRLSQSAPRPPPGLHPALRLSGATMHVALYVLLLLLPLTGWLASSAANSPVSWWGWLTLPDLIRPGETSFEVISAWHAILTRLLLLLVILHAAAALIHHFVLRDDVLRRMLPGWPGMSS